MTPETTPEVRELYRSAPEGFIAARDILAKRLRDDGRDADAAEVKKLRRPTVAAWSLDRLADIAPDGIEALLDAGAELARAQRATLSGRDPKALREATARRRDLVAELSQTAADALRDAGRSPDPHLEDIRGTLEAASVDEEIGERLRTGTIERTSRPSAGFGDIAGCSWCPGATTPPMRPRPRRHGVAPGRAPSRTTPSGRANSRRSSAASDAIATRRIASRPLPKKRGRGWPSRSRR